jgi:hypothetical protein
VLAEDPLHEDAELGADVLADGPVDRQLVLEQAEVLSEVWAVA